LHPATSARPDAAASPGKAAFGQVVASTADEAIEVASVEFRSDAWKLIAVRRWAVA
jgi:hypothetical protein